VRGRGKRGGRGRGRAGKEEGGREGASSRVDVAKELLELREGDLALFVFGGGDHRVRRAWQRDAREKGRRARKERREKGKGA